jgi:predicted phage terminase large subunit-like protein
MISPAIFSKEAASNIFAFRQSRRLAKPLRWTIGTFTTEWQARSSTPRELREALEKLRDAMTRLVFSAQYQQRPIPLEGNIIKREWLRYFRGSLLYKKGEYYVISWDTAMKSSELADYSVGTVWQVHDEGKNVYLVDLVRDRFEFPELVHSAEALFVKWKTVGSTHLVIEDKGSGTSLIQALKDKRIWTTYHNMKLDTDKVMRITAQAAQFYAGSVHFPENAPWPGELFAELFAFPGVKHDDQVDSISQALGFINWVESNRIRSLTVVGRTERHPFPLLTVRHPSEIGAPSPIDVLKELAAQ